MSFFPICVGHVDGNWSARVGKGEDAGDSLECNHDGMFYGRYVDQILQHV